MIVTCKKNRSVYWHFNVKLLQYKSFCESFKHFWETWKKEKTRFDNVILWWEVGKAHIRDFCQQYTSHSVFFLFFKQSLEWLEREILAIEQNMIGDLSSNVHEWSEKKLKLRSILNEKVKGALVRNRFLSIKDKDSPTSFFFQSGTQECTS